MTQLPRSDRSPRINVRRLAKLLVWGLIVPLTAAFLFDNLTGTAPWATLIVVVLCIPLTTVLVSRAALQEMDRIIQVIAPSEQLHQE